MPHYREYLLFIYFQSVLTKINGKRYFPLSSAFQDPKTVQHWSMEGVFIACLGLSFRQVSPRTLTLYEDIIVKHNLDYECIMRMSMDILNGIKFPSKENSN